MPGPLYAGNQDSSTGVLTLHQSQTAMASASTPYRRQIEEEIEKIPMEFLPSLLKLLQAFRETVQLPAAEDTFRAAWKEAKSGQTHPISELWEGIEAE
jgi:hypothetical protein